MVLYMGGTALQNRVEDCICVLLAVLNDAPNSFLGSPTNYTAHMDFLMRSQPSMRLQLPSTLNRKHGCLGTASL